MAAIDFPDSPSNGSTYTNGSTTWTYNSAKGVWNVNTAPTVVAAGSNTQIQFNNQTVANGSSNLTFNVAANVFSVGAASNTLIANITDNTITVGGMILQSNTLYSNVTIQTGQNGLMAGPITIANGVVVTISNGSRFVVL